MQPCFDGMWMALVVDRVAVGLCCSVLQDAQDASLWMLKCPPQGSCIVDWHKSPDVNSALLTALSGDSIITDQCLTCNCCQTACLADCRVWG